MYLPFYGLAEKPFSITPDPRFLYLGSRHAEALAHLLYGVTEAGGFIQLTGEVGTGKTTIIRSLLARPPEQAEIALILNPSMSATDFVLTVCEELGIMLPDDAVGSIKDQTDILNRYLLKAHGQGKRVVLIVDEAQTLSRELLEQVRLLTNLETATQKLLQIILIGQPELRDTLARNDLRQLAQRITGRYHLDPLSREETASYVKHRLRIAGATRDIFTPGALSELHRVSGGIPRLINIIGDRALLGGFTQDRHVQNAAQVRRAASEVFGKAVRPVWLPWVACAVAAMLLGGATWLALSRHQGAQQAVAPAVVATPPAEVAPPPAPAPPPDLAQLLREGAAATGVDGAWSRLFALWGAQYTAGSEAACSQALRQGLECLEDAGGIEDLRRFNRPAILSLADDSGAMHQVVIAELLDGERARLAVGDATHEVPLAQVQQRWSGGFELLWKPPQLDTRNLSIGMYGETVRNLRTRLNTWAGTTTDPGVEPDFFDDSLQQLVMRFQADRKLAIDGVAGTRTQALLDAAIAAPGTPLLTATR